MSERLLLTGNHAAAYGAMLSRAEVIRQRSLGKILTLCELAAWAERTVAAGTAQTKKGARRGSRAA